MIKKMSRSDVRRRKHLRIRRVLSGTAERPRLAVFRSLNHIYAQVIDDTAQKTLTAASSLDPELRKTLKSGANKDAASQVGALIAARCKDAGIDTVVFDRGGNLYHGRIAALAAAARENGLKF